jgi:SpoVK/Ycf46/Vps4 family AAA+-type ATPase
MLPKLLKINDNRRLVFVVATNHIEAFDAAIRRPGRFDVILQVMPPTTKEKMRNWSVLSGLKSRGLSDKELREKLDSLTYAETEILAGQLGLATTSAMKRERLERAQRNCTLLSPMNLGDSTQISGKEPAAGLQEPAPASDARQQTWKAACEKQRSLSRVL